MRLVMVDAEEGLAKGEGHRLRCACACHQSLGQAGTEGGGHGFELRGPDARLVEGGGGDGQQVAQVFTRGEFGHHAAVFGMKLDLGGDYVGEDAAVVDDGGAGFVAGGFEGEKHRAYFFAGSAAWAATLPTGLPCLS